MSGLFNFLSEEQKNKIKEVETNSLISKNSEKWKECFNIKPQILCYIHDNYYEKYYPWFKEIPEKYKVKIICPYQY